MKTLLTILTFIFTHILFGQTKTLTNVTNKNGDTSMWYKYQNVVIKDLSLSRLDLSTSTFHFRIWKTNQALDIWQTSDASYAGQLTSWVTEQTPTKEKPTDRTLINKKILSTDTLNEIVGFIKTSQIMKLPADDSIKGWKHGFDGVTYIIEFSTKATYSFKTYWTPKAQDTTLAEAKYLQSFVDNIFELSNSTKNWKEFEKSILYECYNVGGTTRCKVLTKKQKRKFAKERKNYRQQSIAKIGAGPWNFYSTTVAASVMGWTRTN